MKTILLVFSFFSYGILFAQNPQIILTIGSDLTEQSEFVYTYDANFNDDPITISYEDETADIFIDVEDQFYSNYAPEVFVTGSLEPGQLGETEILITAADIFGSVDSVNLTIIFQDVTPPEIYLAPGAPSILLFECGEGVLIDPFEIFYFEDSFASQADMELSWDASNVNFFEDGVYVVTYTAVDPSGNVSNPFDYTYIVEGCTEPIPLVIDLDFQSSNPIYLNCGQGTPIDEFDYFDIEGGVGTIEFETEGEVDFNNNGTYEITYTAYDDIGTSSNTITITYVVENCFQIAIPPNGQSDTISLECGAEEIIDPFTYFYITQTPSVLLYDTIGTINTGLNGIYPVEYEAYDPTTNITSLNSITLFYVVDNCTPIIELPQGNSGDIGLNCYTDTLINPNDFFVQEGTALLTYQVEGTVNLEENGTYPVTYSATDNLGNTSEPVILNYIIEDCNPPEDWAMGIDDLNLSNAVQISPNPSNGLINLTIEEEFTGASLSVFNMQGQELSYLQDITGTTSLDFTSFTLGVYFLKISTRDAVAVKRIVIE